MVVGDRLWFDAVVTPPDQAPLHRALDRWAAAGKAVIVITHLLAEHDRVDRVLKLEDGVLQ